MIKKYICLVFFATTFFSWSGSQVRDTIKIPGIPGFTTIKYDPHLHTVFSDGLVWPTIRVHEAWREGLDAISITDHIEYRPFEEDVVSDHNRAYEVAKPLAGRLDIMLIHGTEVTREMPPGHFNAVFLEDANQADTDDWREAIRAAKDQNAFIFWNHPGWARQQPDTTLWWDEHTWLLENEMLHGIEIVNGNSYYPEAHQWCLDKGLTMIGTTDAHNPIGMYYNFHGGERRPMTLVFAREKSVAGVREALFAGRTVVYFDNMLIGKKEYLDPMFENSLEVKSVIRNNNGYSIRLYNPTDIPVKLSKDRGNDPLFEFFRTTTIPAGGYVNVRVFLREDAEYDNIELKLVVDNFIIAPGKGLPVTMKFTPGN